MSKIESAVQWAINIANDNSHGYSQQVRWGASYDCSSLIISAWEQAGVKVKTSGAVYTGNMKDVFIKCGFVDVTNKVNLLNGANMQRGDVLLNIKDHVAMHIGDGKVVHARSSEGTTDVIDNSGNEIRCQSYWNYPWDCVLRFNEGLNTTNTIVTPINTKSANKFTIELSELAKGDKGKEVETMQKLLIAAGYSVGVDGADGDFGNNTELALKKFQAANKLSVDGIYGKNSATKLIKG